MENGIVCLCDVMYCLCKLSFYWLGNTLTGEKFLVPEKDVSVFGEKSLFMFDIIVVDMACFSAVVVVSDINFWEKGFIAFIMIKA